MIFQNMLIKVLNKILETNQGSRKILAKFCNHSFNISLFGVKLAGQIDSDGFIVYTDDNKYTVSINIPLNASSYLINNDKLDVYKKISFTGDSKFGRTLLETLSGLHLNGIYSQINSPIFIFALNQIHKLIKGIKEYLSLISSNATISIKEYLLYESQDLITKSEINFFCDEVDELRRRVDRLAAKINAFNSTNQMNTSTRK